MMDPLAIANLARNIEPGTKFARQSYAHHITERKPRPTGRQPEPTAFRPPVPARRAAESLFFEAFACVS
jgi:hypothetical protein